MSNHFLGRTLTVCLLCETVWANHVETTSANKVNEPPPQAVSNADVAAVAAEVQKDLGGYTAYSDCTYFTNRFHRFAAAKKLDVYSVSAFCGGDVGHAFNMIKHTDGKYYFVEPQSGTVHQPGFTDPNTPDPKALCTAMFGQKLKDDGTCPCTFDKPSSTPVQPNPSPALACALSEKFRNRWKSVDNYRECVECCPSGVQTYMVKNNQALYKEWNKQCVASCKGNLYPDDIAKAALDVPRPNDSMAVAWGRTCNHKATDFAISSKWEQCRGCCYDGATQGKYPRSQVLSCLAPCREYQ